MTEKAAEYNVHVFPAESGWTPQQALLDALEIANKQGFDVVLVVGADADGSLVIRASDMMRKDALWLAECAKRHALEEEHE